MARDRKSDAAGGGAEDRADAREEARLREKELQNKKTEEKIKADESKPAEVVNKEERAQHTYWRQRQLREEFTEIGGDEPPDLSPKKAPNRPR